MFLLSTTNDIINYTIVSLLGIISTVVGGIYGKKKFKKKKTNPGEKYMALKELCDEIKIIKKEVEILTTKVAVLESNMTNSTQQIVDLSKKLDTLNNSIIRLNTYLEVLQKGDFINGKK